LFQVCDLAAQLSSIVDPECRLEACSLYAMCAPPAPAPSCPHLLPLTLAPCSLLQRPLQRHRALFELALMVDDPRPRIKECAAAAVQAALLPPRASSVADAPQSNFLRQLMEHLKSVGGLGPALL